MVQQKPLRVCLRRCTSGRAMFRSRQTASQGECSSTQEAPTDPLGTVILPNPPGIRMPGHLKPAEPARRQF